MNNLLINRYYVSINEEVFISGDFATYMKHDTRKIFKTIKYRYVWILVISKVGLNYKNKTLSRFVFKIA